MKKYIPYIGIVVVTVLIVKIIDWTTDTTDDLERDKQELIEKVNEYKNNWMDSERNRLMLEEENIRKDKIIQAYETENDSIITAVRDANNERDFATIDSLGSTLLDRMRRRRQH